MNNPANPIQTCEWRRPKCRSIPWNCEEWVLNRGKAVLERDTSLHLNHYDSSDGLEESAAAGCGLCINLRARVLHWVPNLEELPSGLCKLWFFRGKGLFFQIGDDYRQEFFQDLAWSKSATWLQEWDGTSGPAPSPRCMKCQSQLGRFRLMKWIFSLLARNSKRGCENPRTGLDKTMVQRLYQR